MNQNSLLPANKTQNAHDDAALDEALAESFPASDPVAISFPPPVVPSEGEAVAGSLGAGDGSDDIVAPG